MVGLDSPKFNALVRTIKVRIIRIHCFSLVSELDGKQFV